MYVTSLPASRANIQNTKTKSCPAKGSSSNPVSQCLLAGIGRTPGSAASCCVSRIRVLSRIRAVDVSFPVRIRITIVEAEVRGPRVDHCVGAECRATLLACVVHRTSAAEIRCLHRSLVASVFLLVTVGVPVRVTGSDDEIDQVGQWDNDVAINWATICTGYVDVNGATRYIHRFLWMGPGDGEAIAAARRAP
jgi:hypothetical protein